MALEAVVFPQYPLSFNCKELQCSDPQAIDLDQVAVEHNLDSSCSPILAFSSSSIKEQSSVSLPEENKGRKKRRRRQKIVKNEEEVEFQRMTHIAVERNRRKLMNDYLFALKSLMPPSYVQRGDQASIVGGAINFVKELEQLVQSLEARKQITKRPATAAVATGGASSFAGFFLVPKCSHPMNSTATTTNPIAEIEVAIVESHANVKVLCKRRPKQLPGFVAGLQNLKLTTLHLNMTSVDQAVIYSFNLKMEEDCQLISVDDIVSAVQQMLGMFEEETFV